MKALFLGFSVTADSNGYVETITALDDSISIEKIAFGGIQPHHLAFFVNKIFSGKAYDYIFLEISTAGFRSFLKKELYLASLLYILREVRNVGAAPVLVDLPREDVNYENDWVTRINSSLSNALGISHINVTSLLENDIKSYLRDGIHTNQIGAQNFGAIIHREIKRGLIRKSDLFESFKFPFEDSDKLYLLDADPKERKFSFARSGFSQDFISLGEGEFIEFCVPDGYQAVGLSFLMGPSSGYVVIKNMKHEREVLTRDQFSYYTRLGVQYFSPLTLTEKVEVLSMNKAVDIKLLKGEQFNGPIENFVGSLLVTNFSFEDRLKTITDLPIEFYL